MPAGMAEKTHDWLVAHLCHDCHALVDGPEWRKDHQVRMTALCKTLERLFDSGVIVVAKKSDWREGTIWGIGLD